MRNDQISSDLVVSIIVLAKNCEKYLLQCVGSIVPNGQVEIIIVDPGSADGTSELVDVLENVYMNRVKVIRKSDKSPAEGLNNGLENVSGDIIGILNGDDIYLPGVIEYVKKHFSASNETDILLMSGIVSNETTNKSKLVYPSKISLKRCALSKFGSTTFLHQGMFVRKNFAKGTVYNTQNRISWDFEYLVELLQKKAKVKRSNKQAAIFRIRPDSISGGKTRVLDEALNNERLSRLILNRQINVVDKILGLTYRFEKFLSSSFHALNDTVFTRNRF